MYGFSQFYSIQIEALYRPLNPSPHLFSQRIYTDLRNDQNKSQNG